MRRGDVVRVAAGKPRPALIVQADGLTTPYEVLICPFTTTLLDAPDYRLTVEPSHENGLQAASQLMVDKVGPARRDRIDGVIGHLRDVEMARVYAALSLVLELGVGATSTP